MITRRKTVFFSMLTAGVLIPYGIAASQVTIVRLWDPDRSDGSTAWVLASDINDAGTMVGEQYGGFGVGTRPVQLNPDRTGAVLPLINTNPSGDGSGIAWAISETGIVVGQSETYIGTTSKGDRAVRWSSSSSAPEVLDHVGTNSAGFTMSRARGVTDSGTTVGSANFYPPGGTTVKSRAVRWDAGSPVAHLLTPLGTDPAGQYTASAIGINNAGTIIGLSEKFDDGVSVGTRPVRWDAGQSTPTELLGLSPDAAGGTVVAINELGTIVGHAPFIESGTNRGPRAVLWDAGSSSPLMLEQLSISSTGAAYSIPYSINDLNQVVGYASVYEGDVWTDYAAVLWDGNEVIDLQTLLAPDSGWNLQIAYGINDDGWIVGSGLYDRDGAGGAAPMTQGFLMQVPEPAGLALGGLVGATLLRRSRR